MKRFFLFLISLGILSQVQAQQVTKQDYARAVSFLWSNLSNKKVFNINTQYNWFADSTGVSFLTQNKDEKNFNKLEWEKMKIERLFDHSRLAKLLTDSLKKEIKATDLPFYSVRYIDKSHLEFTTEGRDFSLDINTYTLSPKKKEEENPMEKKSPDGKWIAYSKEHNLY